MGFLYTDQYGNLQDTNPFLTTQYAMSTAQNVARPATLPGASDAPTLDQLLYPPPPAPMPTDRTVSPSGQTGDSVMPTFGASTTQLDIYRIAFLAAGVLIGWKLLK